MTDRKYEQFVSLLDSKLQSANCKVWRKPQISSNREVALFASRIYLNLVRIPVHLFIDYVDDPTQDDFLCFFEEGLEYGTRAFSANRYKRFYSTVTIVPVICCPNASNEVKEYASSRHRLLKRHWEDKWKGFSYFPVLCCLDSKEIHYFGGFDLVGAAIWPKARRLVKETVGAVVSDPGF